MTVTAMATSTSSGTLLFFGAALGSTACSAFCRIAGGCQSLETRATGGAGVRSGTPAGCSGIAGVCNVAAKAVGRDTPPGAAGGGAGCSTIEAAYGEGPGGGVGSTIEAV